MRYIKFYIKVLPKGGVIVHFDTPTLAPDIFFLRKVAETFKHVALDIQAEGDNFYYRIEFLANPYLATNEQFENWIRAIVYPFIATDLALDFVYVD